MTNDEAIQHLLSITKETGALFLNLPHPTLYGWLTKREVVFRDGRWYGQIFSPGDAPPTSLAISDLQDWLLGAIEPRSFNSLPPPCL